MNYILMPNLISECIIIILIIYSGSSNKNQILKNKIFNTNMYVIFASSIVDVVRNILSYNNLGSYNKELLYINTLFFAITPIIAFLYLLFCYAHYKNINYRFNKGFIVKCTIPYLLYLLLLIINIKYNYIFGINSDNVYVKGNFYGIYYLIYFIYSILTIILVNFGEKSSKKRSRIIINLFPLTIIIFMIVQKILNNISIECVFATLTMLIVYLYIQNKSFFIDALTKLYNRRSFFNLVEGYIKQEKNFSIIIISLDDFKLVNDKFGQKRGDLFLANFSTYLTTIVNWKNAFRYNGDEFALIIRDEKEVENIINNISTRLKDTWKFDDIELLITACISVIKVTKEKNNLKEIISILEYSISKIKNKGKDGIIYCDEKIKYELTRKNYIIELMKKEIINNGFEVYYQPIYDVKKGIFTKAEALARIIDKDIGLISPQEFIPIAEETGLIFDIGYIILGKTCAFIKRIEKENIEIDNISVNFSPLQFEKSDVVNKIKNIITYYDVNPKKICIEITEDIMFDRNDDFIMKIKELHNWGIKFYLDDFGTGYSNISRVIQFPFDIIKIDKSIIDNCVKNNETYILLRALTSAFSNVNTKVLVEGVETEKQKMDIETLCNYIQGYYFSEPIPESEVLKFFGEKKSYV